VEEGVDDIDQKPLEGNIQTDTLLACLELSHIWTVPSTTPTAKAAVAPAAGSASVGGAAWDENEIIFEDENDVTMTATTVEVTATAAGTVSSQVIDNNTMTTIFQLPITSTQSTAIDPNEIEL
jgi:hypothetical protein